MKKNVHEGHRERVKKQFLKEGFPEHVEPHKVLEMLLFYSIPRKDTNVLAHELLQTFGSFSGVFDAPCEELLKVPGVTLNTVCLIKMIMPIAKLYLTDRKNGTVILPTRQEACEHLFHRFLGETNEIAMMMCLDNKGKLLSCDVIGHGDINSVGVSARKVLELAIKHGATSVILAHNHPRGLALPSNGDLKTTIKIAEALQHIGVYLIDHIIVADDDYVSMAETDKFAGIFNGGL